MNSFFICDCHNDFLTELDFESIKQYLNLCNNENVKVLCSSFWTSKMNKAYIKKQIGERAELLKENSNSWLFHVEDMWWVENKRELADLLKLKPFSCSLTWNDWNLLAGGAFSEGELTNWGRFCTEKLLQNGTIIDTAHLNRKSFYQVADIIKKNIYCSHTAFYGYKRHKRNLTDKQIELIVNSNGFIGLYFYHKALKLNGDFSCQDIVQNLKYFTSRWGSDNIGIGSDFYGIDVYPKDLKGYQNFDKLYCAMKEGGFSSSEIDKIFYQNFINFMSRVKGEKYET